MKEVEFCETNCYCFTLHISAVIFLLNKEDTIFEYLVSTKPSPRPHLKKWEAVVHSARGRFKFENERNNRMAMGMKFELFALLQ
jgi:hypothetical protein|tara:strand:+ start:701 stop:952 length:252 start_codon:yes stop_codon:yes gene_type:complete